MNLRNLLAFGTGIGIQIQDKDLEVVAARVRPSGVNVLGRILLAGFQERPAADWGAEYGAFLKRTGATYLSATVLLPRADTIVRQIALPGVTGRDLAAAVSYQLDSLHPYGEDEVVSGWRQIGEGQVLIGIVRRDTLERYMSMFAEAGISVASFTFSASVVHSALRLLDGPPAAGFAAIARIEDASVEIYGENPGRPLFSAEFELPLERSVALAASELRLSPDVAAASLESMLPTARKNPIENNLQQNALPYATALSAACPWLAPLANLLPPEKRAARSRVVFVPTAVLAGLVLLVALSSLAFSAFQNRHYLGKLEAEIQRLEPLARRAGALDRQINAARDRTRLLDEFRSRTRADLDTLNALSRLLPPPAWTNGLEVTRSAVTIQGEAEQAAGIIKILDDSPFFQSSELFPIGKTGNIEIFRIRTEREGRK